MSMSTGSRNIIIIIIIRDFTLYFNFCVTLRETTEGKYLRIKAGKLLGVKKDKVIKNQRQLHTKQLHNVYSYSAIARTIE
jgi:hypothetical protein